MGSFQYWRLLLQAAVGAAVNVVIPPGLTVAGAEPRTPQVFLVVITVDRTDERVV